MTQRAAGRPVVLLDLDRMLFDTDRFMHDMVALLGAKFGVAADAYLASYPSHRILSGELHRYDFFAHLQFLGLEPDAVERTLEADLSGTDFLYDDVPAFIRAIRPHTDELLVLTHGEHRFQYLKYHLCPLLRTIEFKDVLTHKREYIAHRFAGRHGVLIDDYQVGELPAGFTHIWVSRYGTQNAHHSLSEIPQLIS